MTAGDNVSIPVLAHRKGITQKALVAGSTGNLREPDDIIE